MTRALMFAAFMLALVAPAVSAQETRAEVAGDADVIVRVDGLACPFCAYGLERKLKALDATASVDIALKTALCASRSRRDRS